MKRYLVFEALSETSSLDALRICNDGGFGIAEVLGFGDSRVEEWRLRAGTPTLTKPSIIKVDGENVQIVQGDMFRFRIMQILGPDKAQQLRQVLFGEKKLGLNGELQGLGRMSRPPMNPITKVQPVKLATYDRRKFLGLTSEDEAS